MKGRQNGFLFSFVWVLENFYFFHLSKDKKSYVLKLIHLADQKKGCSYFCYCLLLIY